MQPKIQPWKELLYVEAVSEIPHRWAFKPEHYADLCFSGQWAASVGGKLQSPCQYVRAMNIMREAVFFSRFALFVLTAVKGIHEHGKAPAARVSDSACGCAAAPAARYHRAAVLYYL